VITTTNGGIITPLQADEIFRGIAGVAFYQLVQTNADAYKISVMQRGDAPVDTEQILKRCRRVLGDKGRYTIRFPDAIKPERSMKYRFRV